MSAASPVAGPRITSTVRIRYGGFMKWVPTSSSGRASAPASSSIGIAEVFEVSRVPGRTAADTSASTRSFSSGISVTDSTTAVAPATSATVGLVRQRPGRTVGAEPAEQLGLQRPLPHQVRRGGEPVGVDVDEQHGQPAADRQRRDADSHHAGPDDGEPVRSRIVAHTTSRASAAVSVRVRALR